MAEPEVTSLSPFEQASAVERVAPLRFRATIPDGWQQGRGAFGGLVLATLARAMEASDDAPGRRLRTLTGDLCGPVQPGEVELVVRALRRGANQTNLAAELVQGGETLATATAVLSAPRNVVARSLQPPAPSPERWQDLPVLAIEPPLGPVFARHYEYRSNGPLPFSGGDAPVAAGFLREKARPTRLDAPALVAYLDAWWPALFATEQTPRVMATVSFAAEFLADPRGLDPALPLAHRARVEAQAEGFCLEFRELWQGDTLVALNQQTFALIR